MSQLFNYNTTSHAVKFGYRTGVQFHAEYDFTSIRLDDHSYTPTDSPGPTDVLTRCTVDRV